MKRFDQKPPSITQRAIHQLREMIFSGELPAGSNHLESELATTLGMSRTPVREAALLLESQGLVELRPRKGVRILPVSPNDMGEIFDVLTELESLAARNAAGFKLGDDDLAPMAQSIDDMQTALDTQKLEDWAEADARFHRALVDLSGNSRVRTVFDLMSDQVRRARAVTLYMRPVPHKATQEHRKVYEAIRAGDAISADATHRTHWKKTKTLILELLERHRLNRI